MRFFLQTSRFMRGLALCLVMGCRIEDAPESEEETTPEPAETVVVPESVIRSDWTEDEAHQAILDKNPGYTGGAQFALRDGRILGAQAQKCGIVNLEPFQGMELRVLDLLGNPVESLEPLRGFDLVELFLDECEVSDLSPLKGMNLQKLYLYGCPVKDLSPLAGAPLVELNLVDTAVEDLGPLSESPLEMLWVSRAPVRDLGPLADCPLVSLTLHQTPVDSLEPIADVGLQRLHIAETAVRDLTPVLQMPLTRLIFTPSQIEIGLDRVRTMPYLTELGVSFEGRMPPGQFWAAYDRGDFN